MKEIKVYLKMQGEKKWSVRYDSVEADAFVRSVYISKKALDGPAPAGVTVTVTAAEEVA